MSELLAAGTPEIVQSCYDSRPGDTDRYDHLLALKHPAEGQLTWRRHQHAEPFSAMTYDLAPGAAQQSASHSRLFLRAKRTGSRLAIAAIDPWARYAYAPARLAAFSPAQSPQRRAMRSMPRRHRGRRRAETRLAARTLPAVPRHSSRGTGPRSRQQRLGLDRTSRPGAADTATSGSWLPISMSAPWASTDATATRRRLALRPRQRRARRNTSSQAAYLTIESKNFRGGVRAAAGRFLRDFRPSCSI